MQIAETRTPFAHSSPRLTQHQEPGKAEMMTRPFPHPISANGQPTNLVACSALVPRVFPPPSRLIVTVPVRYTKGRCHGCGTEVCDLMSAGGGLWSLGVVSNCRVSGLAGRCGTASAPSSVLSRERDAQEWGAKQRVVGGGTGDTVTKGRNLKVWRTNAAWGFDLVSVYDFRRDVEWFSWLLSRWKGSIPFVSRQWLIPGGFPAQRWYTISRAVATSWKYLQKARSSTCFEDQRPASVSGWTIIATVP